MFRVRSPVALCSEKRILAAIARIGFPATETPVKAKRRTFKSVATSIVFTIRARLGTSVVYHTHILTFLTQTSRRSLAGAARVERRNRRGIARGPAAAGSQRKGPVITYSHRMLYPLASHLLCILSVK